jgi:hypothetical protein
MFMVAVQGFAGAKMKRSCMKSVLGWSVFLQSQRAILKSVGIYISFVCNCVYAGFEAAETTDAVNKLRKEVC